MIGGVRITELRGQGVGRVMYTDTGTTGRGSIGETAVVRLSVFEEGRRTESGVDCAKQRSLW